MKLTVLNVAYPLAPVGLDAVGGAEQVLAQLDAALVQDGHRSLVIACAGSRCQGVLLSTGPRPARLDAAARRAAQRRTAQKIQKALRRWPVDVVHLHGVDCLDYLPPAGKPLLITLHLPPDYYPKELFALPRRPRTFLNGVSYTQWRCCPEGSLKLGTIANGVPVKELQAAHARRGFALALGRICPEKGFHLALEAANRASIPLWIGGELFGYATHRNYFREEIAPRLNGGHRFLGPLNLQRKRRLLTAARCLLVPSLAPETSSLVAMEALACGTPVIAFPAGALVEIIDHGRTGYLVRNEQEMAAAIHAVGVLRRADCRAVARERFTAERMTAQYLQTYQRIARAIPSPLPVNLAPGAIPFEPARPWVVNP